MHCCLPKELREALSGYEWRRQSIGRSGAESFLLTREGAAPLFLKTEGNGRLLTLSYEASRLRWLSDRGLDCPRVLALAEGYGQSFLITSAVPGTDMVSAPETDPVDLVHLAAQALGELHAVDVASCPFDHRLDRRFELARERMESGAVDEDDFDEERLGRSARDLFRELVSTRPADEDLVVAHGDACLPNLMVDRGRFAGFVDCGGLGVQDRWQDIALASRSIERNLGPDLAAEFLDAYGAKPDPARIAFYRLLDEFF